MLRIALIAALILAQQVFALGDQPPGWVAISDGVTKQLADAGTKIDWPGATGGVAVDRTTGELYMVVCGQGIWKSNDQGTTFSRVDQGTVGGRCEFSYALSMDPAGQRLACFMLDGKCAIAQDGGKTWRRMKDQGRNWDFGAVDWNSPDPKAIYASRHEVGGETYISHDAGQNWTLIEKGPRVDQSPIGIFDDHTLVTSKGEGILRSTDGGATWNKVAELQPVGKVMVLFNSVGYWLGKDSLLVSKDRGATWDRQGSAVEAMWGPLFGKDEKQIIVLGPKGFLRTTDGGMVWTVVAPRPALDYTFQRPGQFLAVAWDPKADILYASRMGSPLLKYLLKPRWEPLWASLPTLLSPNPE